MACRARDHSCVVAFTLIELLMIVAVVGILASLLLPALVMAKMKAQGAYCLNNMKQMGLAWSMYSNLGRWVRTPVTPLFTAARETGARSPMRERLMCVCAAFR